VIEKLQSRKFITWMVAMLIAIAGMLSGGLSFPEFMLAVGGASATYQAAEGIADAGHGIGSARTEYVGELTAIEANPRG